MCPQSMTTQPNPGGHPSKEWLVYLVFFASGISGLLFETLWFAQAGLALGNSYWAATAVLAAFMTGLALGNLAAMKGFGSGRYPLRIYAGLETVIAITGVALIFGLPLIGKMIAPTLGGFLDHTALVTPIRFTVAFVLLLIPSTAMGLTLPILTRALSNEGSGFQGILGRLYGWNTLGAVAGTLVGEIWLVERLGIRGTGILSGLLNITAAATAWWLSKRLPQLVDPPERKSIREGLPPGLAPWWIAIAASGFLLLALEVVWLRFLSLYVAVSSLAFATMLAIVLLGISGGGLIATMLPRRLHGPGAMVSSVPFLAGALCALSYALFPRYHALLKGVPITTFWQVMRVGLPLMFPVSLCSGFFFTLSGAALREVCRSAQATAGVLTLFNTLGAAAGAIAAGVLFIPILGIEYTLFLLALIYGGVGALWWTRAREGRRIMIPAVVAWFAAVITFPFGTMAGHHFPAVASRWTDPSTSVIKFVREGASETVLYVETRFLGRPHFTRLLTNSYSMSGNSIPARRYMKEFVYWPLAVHPHPKRALLICFGVGSTAKALTDTKELESIDIVDISKDIIGLSGILFPDPKTHPLKDPRVKVHIEDGRFFLQATSKKFDLITGEPPPPMVPGVASLYSREYFQLLRDHLEEGGIATYWLPINQLSESSSLSILRAFSDVFETSFLWRSSQFDFIVMGIKGKIQRVSDEGFARQWQDSEVLPELARLGFETPAQIGSGFVGDRTYIRKIVENAEPLVDDFPKRILTPPGESHPVYDSWFNVGSSKARFTESGDIRKLWPPGWFERTIPAFADDFILSSMGDSARRNGFPNVSQVDRLCMTTSLKTPVLWILRSNGDMQRIINALVAEHREDPLIHYHLGVRHIALQEFGKAADEFALAYSKDREDLIALRLYALAMAGRLEEMKTLRKALSKDPGMERIPQPYWQWLDQMVATPVKSAGNGAAAGSREKAPRFRAPASAPVRTAS